LPRTRPVLADGAINQAGHRIRLQFGFIYRDRLLAVTTLRSCSQHSSESRERDRLAGRDGQQPIKSDPGAGLKNDWVTALLVALQLVMLVLLSLVRSDNQHQRPSRHGVCRSA